MKVAIVHEYLNQYGGAERVLEALHELFPEAPVYTLIHDPHSMPDFYQKWNIRESPYLKRKFIRRHYKSFFFLYPIFVEHFNLREYDLVISSSYAYAHGVLTSPSTCHICFCHTPMRFVWVQPDKYREKVSKPLRWIYDGLIHLLRLWDQSASQRPDYYIAASRIVAERVQRYYRRESVVIHPPIDIARFYSLESQENYYLLVSRLVLPYKRIDLAIDAFNQLGLPLKIAGDGTDRPQLEKLAKSNIQFLGHLTGSNLVDAYAKCKALIFPGEDDFGIVPLEANACGRPVIAYRAGGVLETQIENITAVYFNQPTAHSLMEAVQRFETLPVDTNKIRQSASRFDKEIFKQKMKDFIDSTLKDYKNRYQFNIIH